MAELLERNSKPPKQKIQPSKKIHRKKFIHLLTTEINNIVQRKSNSKKVIVFMSVILQKSKDIKKSKDVKALLERRMTLWQKEEFDTVVNLALFASNTYKRSEKKKSRPNS